MLPETIVLVTAAIYLALAVDFSKPVPTRQRAEKNQTYIPKTVGALALIAAVIYDTVKIFEVVQDPETGDFILTNFGSVNWLGVGIVSAIGVAIFVAATVYARKKENG